MPKKPIEPIVTPIEEAAADPVETGLAEVAADQQLTASSAEAENLPPPPEEAAPVEDKLIEVIDPEQKRIDDFREELLARRNAPEPVYTPPARSERQMTQTELELAAGRKANERHAVQQANRPVPKVDRGAGSSTPVFRPADHVPNMQQGNNGARNARG